MADIKVGDSIRFKTYEELLECYGTIYKDELDIPRGCNKYMERVFKENQWHEVAEVYDRYVHIAGDPSQWGYDYTLIADYGAKTIDLKDVYG